MSWGSKLKLSDLNDVKIQLSTLNIMIDRLLTAQKETQKEVKNIHYQIDDKIKQELNTVERKYIEFLEGKLINFDLEVGKIKQERNSEFYRMQQNLYKQA